MKYHFLFIILFTTNLFIIHAQNQGTFTDPRDGRTYATINIEEQIWMAENLNYASESGSWCFENNQENCDNYGRIYNWETSLNVCPPGWRLPTTDDYVLLINNVGVRYHTRTSAYLSLKEGGESGFEGKPAGSLVINRHGKKGFNKRNQSSYWTSDERNRNTAHVLSLVGGIAMDASIHWNNKSSAVSVRCIKNDNNITQ